MSVKPAYTHSIVLVKANEVIPDTFLRKLCSEHGSCVGLVVREPNKLEIEKFLELGAAEDRFKVLSGINQGTKKFTRQFVFGAFPAEFDEDECQPWIVIKDSKNSPLLTVSCEGDFVGRTSNEGFSEAYVLMHEYLGPKLEEMFKLSANNPTKLFEFLNSESFKKDLYNTFSFRGAFGFMPTIGEPLMLGNFRDEGKGGSDYTWGTASFDHGYTEAVVQAATAAPKEATMPKNPPKVSKYASEEPAAPQPSVPPVPMKTDPPKPEEKVAEDINALVDWAPPKGLHGKALKKAYRDMLGELPGNWQDRPSFRIKSRGIEPAATPAAAPPKDMKAQAPKPVLPVIDGQQQAKAVDFIKKYLGDGSVQIDDNPLELQKQESTLAVFSELCLRTGNLDELERWPVSGLFAFVKEHPQVAALALIEYRRDRINRKQSMKDAGKTLGELTGTEAAPATTPDTTPATPPASEPSTPSPTPAAEPVVRRSKYA